jgi:cytochrome b561
MTTSSFDDASAMMHQNDVSGIPRDRYTRVAIVLHWAIAAFIVFNLGIGFFMESWPPPIRIMASLVPMPKIAPIEAIGEEPGGVAPQHRLHDEFVAWHSVGGYLLLGLLVLHVAGALKHQFIDRQSEFARMGIGRRRQS